jgi:hypothetical protein
MLNETFVHPSRDSARQSAHAGGWDIDDLMMSVDGDGKWGWTHYYEENVECTLIAPPQLRRPDAPAFDVSVEPESAPIEEVVEDESVYAVLEVPLDTPELASPTEAPDAKPEPVLMSHNETNPGADEAPEPPQITPEPAVEAAPDDVTPGADDEPEAPTEAQPEASPAAPTWDVPKDDDEALREAQPGDLILQINGPMLAAAAKLRAMTFAKQLGVTVTLRDATTLEIIGEVKASKRGRGGDPTDLVIELCSRMGGATLAEIAFAAKESGCTIKGKPAEAITKIASDNGYTLDVEPVIRGKSAKIAYFFHHQGALQNAAE